MEISLDCMTEETIKLVLKDIPIHILETKPQQMRIFILCMGITKTFIRYGFPITVKTGIINSKSSEV